MPVPVVDLDGCQRPEGGDMQAEANIDLLFDMFGLATYYRALFFSFR